MCICRYYFLIFLQILFLCQNSSAEEIKIQTVIELFTSQGCSSCPPADLLLKELSNNPNTLVLSYHVDYWDGLGWKDPLSNRENTLRQYFYANARNSKEVFTPQAIINGHVSVVGSDRAKMLSSLLDSKQHTPWTTVNLFEKHNAFQITINQTDVSHLKNLPANIYLIGYQKSAHNKVPSGENAGAELSHVNSVLEIRKLAEWTGESFDTTITIPKGDGLAVILQSDAGQIIGANWK